ncbi:MAG: SUF system NifU family Fe-S cluster assembly protein [Rhodoferax sp.]|nr:SUF system NifU family Fe-S cluster assembly protein [Rhodoferax sp.]
MSADLDLYQDIVLEHKRAPRNFGALAGATHQAEGSNPQCGDQISVALTIEHDRIAEVSFQGQGCAICMASTSMMTEAIKGASTAAAQTLQERFRGVLTGADEPDEAYLGKLMSLAGVARYPSRIKCALLGWHALGHALQTPAPAGAQAQAVRP